MATIVQLLVVFAIIAVAWWFLKKVLHIGFIIAMGLLLLAGWWWFFVR